MRRSVQGARVRVPRPLARRSAPLEQQRAALGATLVRYQHSPIWQTLENQCVSMRCSIMSKRTEKYGRWQVWRCPLGVQHHAQPVGAPARGYDAAGRCQCAGRVRVGWQEIRIAIPSRDWHWDIYAPERRGDRRPHDLPPDHACAGV